MSDIPEPPFAIWQGFRHSWTYNHRLNRIGDWLETISRDGDTLKVKPGHSAASGIGPDEASFHSFRTATRAGGVQYHDFKRTVSITSKEQESQTFVREIRVGPEAGIPDDFDTFVAFLGGFDLCSEKDADKLINFDLAACAPERDPETGEIVFAVIGTLNVDCDSPECDNYATTGGMIAAIATGAVVGLSFLGGAAGAAFGGLFGGLFAKLNITTDYTLEFRCALLSGHSDHFHVTRPPLVENSYDLDKETAVLRKNEGTKHRTWDGDDDPRWQIAVPAITQISLEVERKGGILKPDTAMHLLEWDMSIIPVSASGTRCVADLELFFRNWRNRESVHLEEHIKAGPIDDIVEGLASHRDAGSATATMGVALLQFAWADTTEEKSWLGSLLWTPKVEDDAKADAAMRSKSFTHVLTAPNKPVAPPTEASLVNDPTVLRLAAEHIL